jgi:hypothetical protein
MVNKKIPFGESPINRAIPEMAFGNYLVRIMREL